MKIISAIAIFIILSSAAFALSVSHSKLNGSMEIISRTTGVTLAKIGDEGVGGHTEYCPIIKFVPLPISSPWETSRPLHRPATSM